VKHQKVTNEFPTDGPPQNVESPTAPARANGANSIGLSGVEVPNTADVGREPPPLRRQRAAHAEENEFDRAVYSGRKLLGFVRPTERGFTAESEFGESIGLFAKSADAARALIVRGGSA
jgi:hypothetical protein